jgi:hypothetical protein
MYTVDGYYYTHWHADTFIAHSFSFCLDKGENILIQVNGVHFLLRAKWSILNSLLVTMAIGGYNELNDNKAGL